MLRNVIKKLTNNLGLKILALLFAVTLWMAVVNLDDPTINKPFTVAVTVENESAVTAMNKYYEIDKDSTNVTFNVLAHRSVLDRLSSSDFKATADMSQLIQGEDKNVVPVEVTALRYAGQLTISRRTQEIKVNLEDLMSLTCVIQAESQGKPAEGYALGDMEVTPNLLKVSGPKTIVSKIDSVKAVVDISGMSTEITGRVVPVLLDDKGEEIDTTRLTMNLATVTVKIDILTEKTVPLKANYSGKPKEGFEVISVSTQPEEITIKGKSDVLNAISAITIPEDVISVQDADMKFDQQVDIIKYLPQGVSLSDASETGIITVKVDVEELERRTFTVPVGNINVDNLPEGYRIEYSDTSVDVIIYGLKDDLDRLSANALRPILDVDGMSAGSHVGQLTVTLDDKDRYIVKDTTVSYTIYSDNNGDDTSADDDSTPDDGGGTDTSADDDSNVPDSTVSDTDVERNSEEE